jgi:hypothetical protein
VVQLLVARGANINQANTNGVTLLFMAAARGLLRFVHALLEFGADVEAEAGGWTARKFLGLEGHTRVTEALLAAETARSVAREGDSEHFCMAIEVGSLPAPIVQWLPVLPPASRTKLLAWVSTALLDSAACYTALFKRLSLAPREHCCPGMASYSGGRLSAAPSASGASLCLIWCTRSDTRTGSCARCQRFKRSTGRSKSAMDLRWHSRRGPCSTACSSSITSVIDSARAQIFS